MERLIDREIFQWDCRGEIRRSDPMAVQRRMAEAASAAGIDAGAAVNDLKVAGAEFSLLSSSEKQGNELAAFRAHGQLAILAKSGFGLSGIEDDQETGWTEAELLTLLQRFWKWCEDLASKKNGSPS